MRFERERNDARGDKLWIRESASPRRGGKGEFYHRQIYHKNDRVSLLLSHARATNITSMIKLNISRLYFLATLIGRSQRMQRDRGGQRLKSRTFEPKTRVILLAYRWEALQNCPSVITLGMMKAFLVHF